MKVRANSFYYYDPYGMDLWDKPYGVKAGILKKGDKVQVKNLHGCPKANTMGMCHIVNPASGEFLGLVCTSSLTKDKVSA